jgi:hypothetical protein
MTIEDFNNSINGVFHDSSLDILKDEIKILETDPNAFKIKEITFKYPDIINFPKKLLNRMGDLLSKVNDNTSLRFNSDGHFILLKDDVYHFYFIELKDSLKGKNYEKALSQLLSTSIRLKWALHLTSNILPENISCHYYLVSTISLEEKTIASKNLGNNNKYLTFITNKKVELLKEDLKINKFPLSSYYKVDNIILRLVEGNSQIITL